MVCTLQPEGAPAPMGSCRIACVGGGSLPGQE